MAAAATLKNLISPYLGDSWKFYTLTQFDPLDHSVSKIGPQ